MWPPKAHCVTAPRSGTEHKSNASRSRVPRGLEFVAADMPFANKPTIHILAAVAKHEREAISARTKAALAAARARGVWA
jgi:Resolvase, N terminal domain